jgi:multidrug efflux system membrane fusion protein
VNRSYIIALSFVAILLVWMISGIFYSEPTEQTKNEAEPEAFAVKVAKRTASPTPFFINVQGQSVANREISLKAQIEGEVTALPVIEGSFVQTGQTIAQLDLQDFQAQLDEQNALLAARELEYERLKTLSKKQYQAQSALEQAYASVQSSKAAIARIELALSHTDIKAPFSGHLQSINIELGDFVKSGDVIASLIDTNILIVEAQVAQQQINQLTLGMNAEIELASGERIEGKVRYIAPRADQQTRTFKVEVAVENSQQTLRAGVSATVKLLASELDTHFLTPALFVLGQNGEIGVRTISTQNIVEFHPVEIVQSNSQGAHVTGLPKSVDLIVSGQGFVKAGVKVKPVYEERVN